VCPTCNGSGQDAVNGKLSMNAIAITPIVKKERKAPLTQKAAGTGGKPTSTSLAAMAGAPAATYV
jgi:hypothetical protein